MTKEKTYELGESHDLNDFSNNAKLIASNSNADTQSVIEIERIDGKYRYTTNNAKLRNIVQKANENQLMYLNEVKELANKHNVEVVSFNISKLEIGGGKHGLEPDCVNLDPFAETGLSGLIQDIDFLENSINKISAYNLYIDGITIDNFANKINIASTQGVNIRLASTKRNGFAKKVKKQLEFRGFITHDVTQDSREEFKNCEFKLTTGNNIPIHLIDFNLIERDEKTK